MFDKLRVHAALPALDLERAKSFYGDKLGLTPTDEREAGSRYELGDGSAIFLFSSSVSSRGGHTQAGIEVNDIDRAVAELRSSGVAFERIDTAEAKTADGIVTEADGSRAAWFKDSEGNLLVLVQFS